MSADKARQVDQEQRSLDAMYACLDAEVSTTVAARARAIAAPVDGPEGLSLRDLEVARHAAHLAQLRSAERSLCFGRIDGAGGGSWHIGRVGLRTDAGDPLLVDWRTEAARPFYSATMVTPLGLRRRRHLRLEGRRVLDVTDEILDGTAPTDEDVVADGPLVSALSSARTGRMREAAATLQTEQDEIVRSAHQGVVVVDGGPGTGKTIVALHRAAYVLYAYPSVAARGVLVFGPNRRFLTYISDVLPSLGENDVRLATLPDLVGFEASRSEPDDVARTKGRAELAHALARWVQDRQPHGVHLEVMTAHGSVVLDAATVDAARRSALQGGVGHNGARRQFTEDVVADVVSALEQQAAQELLDFEAELKQVQGIDLDRMFGGGRSGATHRDDVLAEDGLDIDWDQIRERLLDDPGFDRIIDRVWPRLQAEDAVRGLLADRVALSQALPDVPQEDVARLCDLGQDGWSTADLALLDEARALVDGLPETTYGHVVVDEAQQLSEMQWRTLMRRCPQRSMTIVGDLAQAGPTTTIGTWDDALQPFIDDRYEQHTLTINYRTTAEILQATEPLLGRIAPDQRLSRSIRSGDQPTTVMVTEGDLLAALQDLVTSTRKAHPDDLIGIIAADHRTTPLCVGTRELDATVVAAPDARGLEFDTVILVDPHGIQTANPAGLRDLYVAQTRATHRLVSLAVGAM